MIHKLYKKITFSLKGNRTFDIHWLMLMSRLSWFRRAWAIMGYNRTMYFLEVIHERIYDFTKTRGVGPQLLTTFIEQKKSKIPEWSLDNLLQIWNILRWSEIQMSYSTKGFNKGPYEKINKSFLQKLKHDWTVHEWSLLSVMLDREALVFIYIHTLSY